MFNCKKIKAGLFVLAVAILPFVFAKTTFAASVNDIYNNVLANTMYNCYNATEMNKTVELPDYSSYNESQAERAFKDLILSGGGVYHIPTAVGSGNGTVANNDNNGATRVSCNTLFLGKGGNDTIKGMFAQFGKSVPSPKSTSLGTELGNLGYTDVTSEKGSLKCLKSVYTDTSIGGGETDAGTICWKTSALSKMTTVEFTDPANAIESYPSSDKPHITLSVDGNGNPAVGFYDGSTTAICESTKTLLDNDDKSKYIDYLASKSSCSIYNEADAKEKYRLRTTVVTQSDTTQSFEKRSMSSYAWGYETARNYFIGNKSLHNFSKEEKFVLYNEYLFNSNIYAASWVSGEECLTRDALEAAGGPVQASAGKYYSYKSGKYCRVSIPDETHYNLDVSIFHSSDQFMMGWCDNVECLLTSIYNLNLPDDAAVDPDNPDNPIGPTNGDGFDCDTEVDKVTNGEGIGAMQWVLCPGLNNTAYTADWVDSFTQDMLEVDPNTYNGLGDVWGKIRDIANVVVAIFLLVVIFSQLTGRGIDNYGIKKMLPRIIMMAITINLSLYICQLAVDLSNIVGVGLRNLFGTMAGGTGNDASYVTGSLLGIFAAAGPTLSAVGTALVFGGWIAVVVGLLALVVVIVAALVVLFVMLGARQIIVIFCILVSPLAFAAFILPNTQGIFKKWLDLFKSAIIIFPICGAVSGVSATIRDLSSSGKLDGLGFGGKLILMVLPFLVFFLLPSLLKQSIAGLGKLGGALTSMGNTIRKGGRSIGGSALRGAQNSEWGKRVQAEVARKRQSDSSQRTIDKLEKLKKKREDAGETLTDAETRRLARAHETQRKLGVEDQTARTILTEKEYANESQQSLVQDWAKAFQDGDDDKMNALTNVIVSRHGPGGVNSLAEELNKMNIFENGQFVGGEEGKMARSFNALRQNMQQNSALASAMQNKASDAFQMISSGGYVDIKDENGNVKNMRANMSAHSKNNNISTQIKDWATQSSATLRRAAENKALTKEVAMEILNSTDPTIQSGIKSDASKREVLEAVAGGFTNFSDNSNPEATKNAKQQAINRTRAVSAGAVSPTYANKSASDVYAEAQDENRARQMGVTGSYIGRTAASVYDEAMADNREFDRAKQQEMNTLHEQALIENKEFDRAKRQEMNALHGQALEENKEFDRRNAERAQTMARDNVNRQIASGVTRIANNMDRNINGGAADRNATRNATGNADRNATRNAAKNNQHNPKFNDENGGD